MSLSNEQRKFTIAIGRLIVHADSVGYTFRFGDAWRSTDNLKCPNTPGIFHTYQKLLFSNGKSKKEYGKHNDRLAIDFIIERKDGQLMTDDDYRILGVWWETTFEGNSRWGGRFDVLAENYTTKLGWDAGHFEWLV